MTEAKLGDDWVQPFRRERETAPTWTAVGTIGSEHEATVDPRGLVTPELGGWSLDWWIGADDRWHVPSREVAVRQRLIDDAPVVESSMRVPGGDAVQRVFGVRDGDRELLVVEIENQSKLPFAVAFAVRPCNPQGLAAVERIGLPDDTTVTVDGRVAVLLPKKPSRVAASTFADGDVATTVMSGGAGESFPADVHDPAGRATAAFVFPLAHTATLRIGLPLGATNGTPRPMASLPSATQVASGWQSHTERGLRFEVPDRKLASCVAANRAALLLRGRDDVDVLGTLDRYGYRREVAEVLDTYPDRERLDAAALRAVGEHWRLHRDRDLVTRLAPWIAHGAERVARAGRGQQALLDASEVLGAAGEETAAADAARMAASLPPDPDAGDTRGLDWLQSMLSSATPTWTWPDAGAATDVLSFVRNLLVREQPGPSDRLSGEHGLALCSVVPDEWLGQGIEVHDAPTHAGLLSYAVRWHGDRPALLWELDRHVDAPPDVRITIPGLDPTWSSTDAAGEALLGVVTPPGQVSVVSLRRS